MKYRFILLAWLLFINSTLPSEAQTAYPFGKDLSQTMTFKIMLRCATADQISNLDLGAVLKYLKQLDNITRGLPKVVILGGYQQDGHDHQYPWWTPADNTFFAPGGLKGKAALSWLMREAVKYHTHCTFHVNPFDAYMESPKWGYYAGKDLICRETDGSYLKGQKWWGRQSYFVDLVNEWKSGVTKERIDDLIAAFPQLKETGVLYFDNITQYPASPYHHQTSNDQRNTIKQIAIYLKNSYGIQLIGEYGDKQLYGYLSQGITWDWGEYSLGINQMEVPPYLMCGGRDIAHDKLLNQRLDIKPALQVFGSSVQFEDIQFQHFPDRAQREFAHHTLTYFNLNRLLRQKYTIDNGDYTLNLSENTVSNYKNGLHTITQDGNLIKSGYDVFMPVYWLDHLETMCYSMDGGIRRWVFPTTWENIKSADIYVITPDTITLKESNRRITNHSINLAMKAGECLSIVPHGINIHRIRTIYELPPSGTVRFDEQDQNTKGNWVGAYGKSGYDVIGGKRQLPSSINLNYVANNLETWAANSTDVRAPYLSSKKEGRVAAGNTALLHEIADVDLKNGVTKKVSLYFLDWQRYHRQMLVDVIDANTKKVLQSNSLSDFDNGVYLNYLVTGHVQFRITRFFYDGYKDPNYPTFSGIFFD
ncbi:endo-alpha-N-acetylgalactosaminidase family protein [Mucilaginibacter sp. UR6-11]|uniref:endo-alpha-N-acetylgalactosaminidase family protein n=1 Tax=Mucilaginibacter sp. UR6-11 TaxID=1435644 RepID=UPI001E2AC293|nr:endo-alpha-N-acetylgalactosaminidase family protein [Mucilaginibacter sp. UR6-11]MCC8423372.1 endo-alpha-N-acetylgalactosaminidase family protein [Mucilaginibacter sp. UR6-11]